ncbi:MAG: hypothetical protein ACREOO_09345 [bacterium]
MDYAYGRKLNYALTLKLPNGYSVLEFPKNITLNVPGEGAQYSRSVVVEGNTLKINSQMDIRKVRFQPNEYKALRDFYDRLVAAQAEQVVLKRGASAPAVKEDSK